MKKYTRVRPRRCYLAGPMRGVANGNYPAFEYAAEELRLLGWYVYNPIEMDAARSGLDPQSSEFPHLRTVAMRDLEIITRLRAEDGDAIVLLPGSRQSIGARAELAAAHWVGLRVLSLHEALTEGWMTG